MSPSLHVWCGMRSHFGALNATSVTFLATLGDSPNFVSHALMLR